MPLPLKTKALEICPSADGGSVRCHLANGQSECGRNRDGHWDAIYFFCHVLSFHFYIFGSDKVFGCFKNEIQFPHKYTSLNPGSNIVVHCFQILTHLLPASTRNVCSSGYLFLHKYEMFQPS